MGVLANEAYKPLQLVKTNNKNKGYTLNVSGKMSIDLESWNVGSSVNVDDKKSIRN